MKKITCEDIGRWMVQNHPEIADAPKEIKGTGFYITPMIYGNKFFVVIFASDGTWIGRSSGELAEAFGSYGGFRRQFRDWHIARMMRRCLKERKKKEEPK